ncbi:hypothetical protein WG66_004435 [Moniliophthora roreri]|uniref:Uncharacterized protein n=1 Tax=Moniliophthora roreri TaxID=221103 RepID=A0A0W0FBX2_MONRR|nr:hypothetical protein WG66_004435 [Moniliophthora roreri]
MSSQILLFFKGWAQILLYGFNVILFSISMFLLRRRGEKQNTGFHIISTIVLFGFATVTAVVTTVVVVAEVMYRGGEMPPVNVYVCSVIIYVNLQLVDLTALTILVHRAYNIWHGRWKILLVPVVLIVADTGLYYTEIHSNLEVPFGGGTDIEKSAEILRKSLPLTISAIVVNLLANGMLTGLIAGRIWWHTKQIRESLGPRGAKRTSRYNHIIAMTLESGMIIPIYLILLGLFSVRGNVQVMQLLSSMWPQVIAIAPLLIVVRAGLGLSMDSAYLTTQDPASIHENAGESRVSHSRLSHVVTIPQPETDLVPEESIDIEMRSSEKREAA